MRINVNGSLYYRKMVQFSFQYKEVKTWVFDLKSSVAGL